MKTIAQNDLRNTLLNFQLILPGPNFHKICARSFIKKQVNNKKVFNVFFLFVVFSQNSYKITICVCKNIKNKNLFENNILLRVYNFYFLLYSFEFFNINQYLYSHALHYYNKIIILLSVLLVG